MKGLPIREVAEATGLATGTIRMWEQRHGFPQPRRTPSGYRVYSEADVETLRRVVAFRERGLSVSAALERARAATTATDRPSLFGALAGGEQPIPVRMLRKATLIAISRAIEDEALARAAGPVVVGAFQRERFYRAVEHRYRRLAERADAVAVFADFAAARVRDDAPCELPIAAQDAIRSEWAVVVDAPGYAVALLGWEPPAREPVPDRERRFEALLTLDPRRVREAAQAGVAVAGRADPALGERLTSLLADRPLAREEPAPALEGLFTRMVGYLEAA